MPFRPISKTRSLDALTSYMVWRHGVVPAGYRDVYRVSTLLAPGSSSGRSACSICSVCALQCALSSFMQNGNTSRSSLTNA
jgi:hypothetical protein